MALLNSLRTCALTGLQIAKTFALSQPARLASTKGGKKAGTGCIKPQPVKKAPKKKKKGRDCVMYTVPVCSEEVLKAKRKSRPCQEKADVTRINPECCPNPCIDMFPRFDDLYYAPSNKNRKYQQTWCEFGRLEIKKWPICCYPEFDIPKPKRRKLVRKKVAKSDMCEMAKQCPNNVHPQCAKIVWPGCRTKRCEFKCRSNRVPSDCKKVCTPFPSFSECDRRPPRRMRAIECDCLKLQGFCPKPLNKEK